MLFGEWLSATLFERGLKQADLARQSDLTAAQISRIVHGESRPGIDAVQGIARALDIPVDEILRRMNGLPSKLVRERRQVVYEINGDDLVLALWRALSPEDQAIVRAMMERLQPETRIIGEGE